MNITSKTDSTLLLVDDDIELCELLEEFLVTEGFNITAVHDGESGVNQASPVSLI